MTKCIDETMKNTSLLLYLNKSPLAKERFKQKSAASKDFGCGLESHWAIQVSLSISLRDLFISIKKTSYKEDS